MTLEEMDRATGLAWRRGEALNSCYQATLIGFRFTIYENGNWSLDRGGSQIESFVAIEGENFGICLAALMNAYRRNAMSIHDTKLREDEMCGNQKRVSGYVSHEIRKTMTRVARDKVFMVMQLGVFAHNCDNKSHGNPDTLHIDFVAEAGRQDIPGSLQAAIKATETLLAALKAKVQ